MSKITKKKPVLRQQKLSAISKTEIINSSFLTEKKIEYIVLLGIVLLTAILFSRAAFHQFLNWDDNILVYDNKFVKIIAKEGFSGIVSLGRELFQNSPLTIISHAITCRIWGMNNPMPYHIINILLHLFNTVFVYAFVKLMTKQWKAAAIAALLFSVHPLRVESVAWIAERKDVLFAFFYLIGMISYVKYLITGKKLWYILVLIAFPLSLFSKFAGVTFPFALLLIDVYFKRKMNWIIILEKVPLFLFLFFETLIEFSAAAAVESVEKFSAGYSIIDRFFFSGYSFVFYVVKFVLPVNLSAMYPYPVKVADSLPAIYHAAPFVAIVFLMALIFVIYKFKNFRSELIFGFLFFMLNIFIVLHFVPFAGNVVMADRYTYIAHLGFCFIAGNWFANALNNEYEFARKRKSFLYVILAGFVLFLMVSTWNRVVVFKDTYTLFTDATEKEPVPLTFYYRGIVSVGLKEYKSAIKDYDKALELSPNYFIALVERAKAKRTIEDYKGSIADFTLAIQIKPQQPDLYNDRGWVKEKNNENESAILDFTKAIELKNNFFEAYMNRANVRSKIMEFKGCLDDYDAALKIHPNAFDVFSYKGSTRVLMNDFEGAIDEYLQAVKMNPGYAEAYNAIGLIKSRNLRNVQDAVVDFTNAIKISPNYKEAIMNRGIALFEMKDFKASISDIDKTITLDPNNGLAYLVRGHARNNIGLKSEACSDWQKSSGLGNQEALLMIQQNCK